MLVLLGMVVGEPHSRNAVGVSAGWVLYGGVKRGLVVGPACHIRSPVVGTRQCIMCALEGVADNAKSETE